MADAKRDGNYVPTLLAVSSADGTTPVALYADPTTHRLYVDLPSGSGTVISVAVTTANGVSGTVATATTTPAITLTLGAITPSSINVSGLTASQAVVTDGSKNLTSLLYTSANTNSSISSRDSNGNSSFNNVISTTTATATSAQTITMSAGSARIQKTTGVSTATFKLPDATNLITGWSFEFNNNSTGTVTIQNAGAGAVTTVLGGAYAVVICTDNSTVNGSWDYHYLLPANITASTVGLNVTGTLIASGHATLEGVTSTGATGTGKLVFDGTPTLVTPTLGVASATTINKVTLTAPATASTLTIADGKTLTISNSITLAGTDSTTMTFPAISGNVATFATTTEASNATTTVAIAGTFHTHTITALAAADTFGAPTIAAGSLTNDNNLVIRIKDNGTARALTWNAIFRASSDLALPSTTVLGKTLYVGFKYNTADTKWDLLAVLNNF